MGVSTDRLYSHVVEELETNGWVKQAMCRWVKGEEGWRMRAEVGTSANEVKIRVYDARSNWTDEDRAGRGLAITLNTQVDGDKKPWDRAMEAVAEVDDLLLLRRSAAETADTAVRRSGGEGSSRWRG